MNAVAGTFVKIEPVATRKVVRLHIECPIESANQILTALGGYPDPANAQWVGIAPLDGEPKNNSMKGGKLAQRAGILCDEPAFIKFAQANLHNARDLILDRCGVTSRAHLDHDEDAAKRFRDLQIEYKNWLSGIVDQ